MRRLRRRLRRTREQPEGGYVAILTALLLTVLMAFVAFTVDVGRWYVVGQELQRTADAAALAGVTSLPGDPQAAFATAGEFAAANGYGGGTGTVVAAVGKAPTQLQTTVTTTVKNIFGGLLGVPRTTISRTAVADYAAPVPMGSPCNEFGNDPDPGQVKGTTCEDVTGRFWANVNSPGSDKQNGDSYQSATCGGGDGCAGATNSDYDPDGYFYTVSVTRSMPNLTIELFDPAWVDVGLSCSRSSAFGGSNASVDARNPFVSDAATRYASGASSDYCTGDNLYGGSTPMNTSFVVRAPSATPWDPTSFPELAGCQKTYAGYHGNLFDVLDEKAGTKYDTAIAESFRRWSLLCSIPNPQVGDYLVQVKTNGLGTDAANDGNRFSIRAYSASDSSARDAVSVSGRQKMGIYSNKPGNVTQFYLARVPSSAAGQVLNVRLYDVGDSDTTGTIKILTPDGSAFSGCTGSSPSAGPMPDCSFSVPQRTYNGRWKTVSVPIPKNYTCADSDRTMCWTRLSYTYGEGSAPTDVTTWTASLAGDPVRLIQ